MYEKITPDNVMMYTISHYDNPHCEGEKEFQDDLKRFKYIKRLLRKYYENDILKETTSNQSHHSIIKCIQI